MCDMLVDRVADRARERVRVAPRRHCWRSTQSSVRQTRDKSAAAAGRLILFFPFGSFEIKCLWF